MPSGAIMLIDSGSCPSGWSEETGLNGKYLLGTIAANADVGGTGGSSSYTPSGSVSQPNFTGTANQTTSAVSAGTPAGTNGTVSFTPAGTNATASFTPSGSVAWPASVPTFTGSAMATHSHGAGTLADATSASTVKLFTSSSSGVSAATLSGSTAAVSAGTPAGTVAWPASVPTFAGSGGTVPAETFTGSAGTVPAETFTGSALGTHSHILTASGTVSTPTFSGNAATITEPYLKLIACKKN